jgi:hypothetical protein
MIANAYRGDWQDDAAWDYRSEIAIWNGVFWLGVAGTAAFWIHVNNRAHRIIAEDTGTRSPTHFGYLMTASC